MTTKNSFNNYELQTQKTFIDVAEFPKTDNGDYILENGFISPLVSVYYDSKLNKDIRSVGRHVDTGEIHASTEIKFHQHPDYELLYLNIE